ncbi:MAG: serine/threonine protein kinase [Planctomycetota bacterium]|nr:MAG: serine/threonine protein kinase [Planctomycetota bacterium]
MATEFHRQVRDVLDAAARKRTAERTAFLRTVTRGDRLLLREALSLLPHYVSIVPVDGEAPDGLAGCPTALRAVADVLRHEPEWEPPFAIAPYTVSEILGCGGMGVVYRGVDPTRHKEVAIKVLRRRLRGSEDRSRFKREEELLRQLKHPNIVRLLHGGEARVGRTPPGERLPEMRPYFVMEYVRGATLSAYADERELSAIERVRLLVSVCRAVQYAHDRGIVHRDLKPHNILVDETGAPKILDFGIAMFESFEFATDADEPRFIGTPAYASPEQASGRAVALTPASDVYSLGLIGHELLAGRLPQRVGARMVVDLRSAEAQPDDAPAPSVCDPGLRYALEVVLARALQHERGRRYAHAGALADDLEDVVNAYDAARGWRALRKGVASFLRGDSPAASSTHKRLLAAILRRRIEAELDRRAQRP